LYTVASGKRKAKPDSSEEESSYSDSSDTSEASEASDDDYKSFKGKRDSKKEAAPAHKLTDSKISKMTPSNKTTTKAAKSASASAPKKRKKEEDVEGMLKIMTLELTGCPKVGVALLGIRNVSQGTQIKLDCIVPPVRSCLDAVKEAGPAAWNRFLTKLGAIPGHDIMSNAEREAWLFANATASGGQQVGEAVKGAKITLLRAGDGPMCHVAQRSFDLAKFLSGGTVLKHGNRARAHA
jgi:hypothetical protein